MFRRTAGKVGPLSGPGRHIAVIALAALLVVGWAASVDTDAQWIAFSSLLGWTLLALGWIDWKTFRLPDALTLPLMALGLVEAWLDSPAALYSGAIGVLAGYGALFAVGVGYRWLRGSEGLGRGDAKLLAAGGAWLGWPALPWVVLLAALFGLSIALSQRVRGVRLTRDTALPFGPALALAIWIIRLYGVPLA